MNYTIKCNTLGNKKKSIQNLTNEVTTPPNHRRSSMSYHHLTIEERSCIRKYYVDGLSYREIARLIRRNVSTVSREIRRTAATCMTFRPTRTQRRRSICCAVPTATAGCSFTGSARLHRGKAAGDLVAEQIACTPCELKLPSWRTIYRWIYEKYLVEMAI